MSYFMEPRDSQVFHVDRKEMEHALAYVYGRQSASHYIGCFQEEEVRLERDSFRGKCRLISASWQTEWMTREEMLEHAR